MTSPIAQFAEDKLRNHEKVKFSEFIETHLTTIKTYDYGNDFDHKTISNTWESLFDDEKSKVEEKSKFVKNSYKVDWLELESQIKRYQSKRNIQRANDNISLRVSQKIASVTEESLDNFYNPPPTKEKVEKNTVAINFLVIRSQIKEWRKTATHIEDKAKQDLLYYGILDMTSNTNTGTKQVLGDDFTPFAIQLNTNSATATATATMEIYHYTRQVLKNSCANGMDQCLKIAKSKIKDGDCSWKKPILKVIKLYHKVASQPNSHYLTLQTEIHYLCTFVQPIMDLIFEDISDQYNWMWGESKLQAAKNQQNQALTDNDRRASGPNIDGVYTHLESGMDIMIVEISGSNTSPAHSHYLDDRIKIAKNLKRMMKNICRSIIPQFSILKKLSLVGLQFYDNKLYFYSLKMAAWGVYVFNCEQVIELPTHPLHSTRKLSTMIRWLYSIKEILKQIDALLPNLFDIGSCDSDSANSLNSPDVSPKKNKRKQSSS